MPHTVAALANVHALPHAPQFETVLSGVSQPSAAMPLQSPKPAAQVLQLPSRPQPRLPVAPEQSESVQQAWQERPPQQCVPDAQSV
jgi:hypothetical protein